MIWFFGYYLGYQTLGVWIAKIVAEAYICLAFAHLLYKKDWREIIEESLAK